MREIFGISVCPAVESEVVQTLSEIQTFQIQEEILALSQLVHDSCLENILEVGVAFGGTFRLWCRLSSVEGIKVAIDDSSSFLGFEGVTERDIENRNLAMKSWANNVVYLNMDSRTAETQRRVEEHLYGGSFDFMFIDGHHSYESVRSDFQNYFPLLRSGGIFAMHDIAVCSEFKPDVGTQKFWEEIRLDGSLYSERYEFVGPEGVCHGIGVLKKR